MSLPLVDIIMINEELELYSSISRVYRYLNLWFLLCPSLLRPFNLIRNEIVWQICCGLLLLTVLMGFIFSSPSPPLLPPPYALSGQNRNTEAIAWKYRCPTIKSLSHWTRLQWEPPGWFPCSCRCAEDWPWQRSSYRRCGRVPFSCLVPGDPSVFAAPTNVDLAFVHFWLHTGTWICSSCEPGMGLAELKHCTNEFDGYQMKSALTANPSFVEKCLQLSWEDNFPSIALPPWYLPPSVAVVGRSSKQQDQWRVGIPVSAF